MTKISRTAAVDLIKSSKGRFFSVTFTKNDGTQRTLNGNVKSKDLLDSMGYVKFKSSKEGHKLINPRTIKSVKINKVVYTTK